MWTLRKKASLRGVESCLLSNRGAARNFSFTQLRLAIVPRNDSSIYKHQPLKTIQYPAICQKRFLSTVEEDNELTQPPPADDASRLLHYQTYYQESEFDSHARKSLQHASDNGDWIADAYLGILHGLDQNNKTGKEKADKIGQSVVPKLLNFLQEERKLEKSIGSKDLTQERDFHSPVVAQACYMLAVYHEMAWGVPRNLPLAIDFYLEAGHRKHKLAQYSLAELARTGDYHRTKPTDSLKTASSASSKPDMDLAMLWYSRAAAQNHAPAQNQMGQLLLQYGFASHMLQNTQQLHALIAQVEQYYKDAAFQGHGPAQFNLGNLYAQPHFLVPHSSGHSAPSSSSSSSSSSATRNDMVENPVYNPSEALRWYVMSADQGYTLAQTMVGICYAQGALGAVQNPETGASWLRRAAKEHDLTAAFHLGTLLYDMFQQEKTREQQETFATPPSAMTHKAENKASFRLPPEEKLKESVHWLRVAAEAGHIDAQMTLAQYLQQQLIPMQYWTEAERQQGGWYLWYETAANKVQHPEALYQLALAYQTPEMSRMATVIAQRYLDKTKPSDNSTTNSSTSNNNNNKASKEADKQLLSTKAKEYLRHAAEQGHVGAQARLGACLYHGQYGIAQNLTEAVPYLEAASAQEDAASMTLLGLTYLLGQGGVPENVEEGKKWIYRAAEMGYPLAKELVEEANSLSD